MALFDLAYQRTLVFEGGYIDDRVDAGQETYKGISRRFNSSWLGWLTIDHLRHSQDFPKNLETDERLQALVTDYYRQQYWDKLACGEIPQQALADELFDTGVNMGIHRAALFLQQGLNALNRNEALYTDLTEDGIVGPKTLTALQTYFENDEITLLLQVLILFRGNHYLNYIRKSPEQEKFARGWLNRLNFEVQI